MKAPGPKTLRIGITLGDPAGIGPEIAARASDDPRVRHVCEPVLYGPSDLSAFRPGHLSADAGRAAYDAIRRAVDDAIAGRIAAVVTCPVNKEAFALAGLPWRGHTDLLAHLTGSGFVAMMFYSSRLVVVLATVHVALRDVPALVTGELVERVVRLTARELPRFGVGQVGPFDSRETSPLAPFDSRDTPALAPFDSRDTAPLAQGRPFDSRDATALAPFDSRDTAPLAQGRPFDSRETSPLAPFDSRAAAPLAQGEQVRRVGGPSVRLAVAGLNPHAGEHGLMGDEDERVLRPAIDRLAADGIDVRGPFPADTVFVRAMRGEFDAVIACYHDQGLIPMKMASFGHAVNVTLGLPIIRTSVDHGTAFDIAGRGIADAGSLVEAILLAARLAQNR